MRPLIVPRFGCARIIAEVSGLYQPHPDGRAAVVLGAHDRAGDFVDVIAWHQENPQRWWARTGSAAVLGEGEIDRAAFIDTPLYLFATPDSWLFNHGPNGRWPAACVVDWSMDPRIIFSGVQVECETELLARRLTDAQRRHDRPLSISVSRKARNVAA